MKMIQREYDLRFCTPAFLGNAEQKRLWRTPPFKAQLRQWWRVAYAADARSKGLFPVVAMMRENEGKLFGNVWLDDSFSKSLVRIRLADWDPDKQRKNGRRVNYPEASSAVAVPYLGYGLKASADIQAGEENIFAIAYPDKDALLIEQALALMNQFGTVGGRSRNGWGSYSLTGVEETLPLEKVLCPWEDAMKIDWPHSIGCDTSGALVWQTQPNVGWIALMKQLAELKIKLRKQFVFNIGKNALGMEDRRWLSYPVTNHSVAAWSENNARLPNSLRFKVRPADDGKLVGVIFHMPCLPPKSFTPQPEAIKAVWAKVHTFLDQQTTLTRTQA